MLSAAFVSNRRLDPPSGRGCNVKSIFGHVASDAIELSGAGDSVLWDET